MQQEDRKCYIPCHRLKSHIVFYGRSIAFCCGDGGRKSGPRWDWLEDGIKSIENFFIQRDILFQELNGLREIDLLRPCLGCRELAENKSENEAAFKKIDFLNYGYIPTLCQCKCIYCSFAECKIDNNYKLAKEAKFAAKFAEVMNYLETNKLLSDNFSIQVASGEITVHPERDELLRIVMKYPCHWFTNAFVYNDAIAENLRNNKRSNMCVSLDCGTAETFKKIKGYDLFDKVIENLSKYNECGTVNIKYIVIPGINDSIADYNGIITLLKKLGHTQLYLSRDTFISSLPYEVLESSALLLSICNANGIRITGDIFSKAENDEIHKLAERGFGVQEIEAYENNYARQHFRNKKLTCANFTAEYRNYFVEKQFAKISYKLKEKWSSKKGVVIWGAGINGTLMANLFNQNGINVYITDSNKLKHGTILSGNAVTSFNEIADKVDTILLSNGSFFDSVKEQVGNRYDIIDWNC